jgi:predicted O-methyltransferase YrrM
MKVETEGYRLMNDGEYYPWYTHPTLEMLDTLDLSDKIVFEFGVGDSSIWWGRRCKKLYGVEYTKQWVDHVNENVKATIEHNQNFIKYTPDWQPIDLDNPDNYVHSISKHGIKFDIIIIDGGDREECVEPALANIKEGGMIIFDNWMQPSVCVQSGKIQERLLAFKHDIYHQPGHPDWKTAVFYI